MKPSLVLAAMLLCPSLASADPTEAEKRFVELALLNGDPAQMCTRWTKTPTLSLFGATPAHAKAVAAALPQFNDILVKTSVVAITLDKPQKADADVKFHFAAAKDLPGVAKKHDLTFPKGGRGMYGLWWNGKGELARAVLLMDASVKGEDMTACVVTLLAHSLGVNHESAEFADSVFYRLKGGNPSAAALSAVDKKLLGFLYNQLQPGAKLADVRAAYKNW
jgi:hypothetical protein